MEASRDLLLTNMPYPDVKFNSDGKSFEFKQMTKDEYNEPHAGKFCNPTVTSKRVINRNWRDDEEE